MPRPLLKTLISEMMESYLEESYDADLVESIFKEVSSETWEAIEEAILNELSPELVHRYAKKANAELEKAKYDSTVAREKTKITSGDYDRSTRMGTMTPKLKQDYKNKMAQHTADDAAARKTVDKRSGGRSNARKRIGDDIYLD